MRRKQIQGLSIWNTNHACRVLTFKSMFQWKKKLSKNIQTYLDIMWLFQNRYPFQWRNLSSSIWVYGIGRFFFCRLGGRASTISHGRASELACTPACAELCWRPPSPPTTNKKIAIKLMIIEWSWSIDPPMNDIPAYLCPCFIHAVYFINW